MGTVQRNVPAIDHPAINIDIVECAFFEAVGVQVHMNAFYLLCFSTKGANNKRKEYSFFQCRFVCAKIEKIMPVNLMKGWFIVKILFSLYLIIKQRGYKLFSFPSAYFFVLNILPV